MNHRRLLLSCSVYMLTRNIASVLSATAFRPFHFVSLGARRSSSVLSASATKSMGSASNTTKEQQQEYWNRETSSRQAFSTDSPVLKRAKILSLVSPTDDGNSPLTKAETLPEGAEILQSGACLDDFDMEALVKEGANVVFASHPNSREPLAKLLEGIPTIEWVHVRSAGLDAFHSPTLSAWKGDLTNAKGQFSSTLGEYTLMACAYFAKDLPRLLKNKQSKDWQKYSVLEMRGATLGIVGFGDIGKAAAKLAAVFGMKILALRRNPQPDPLCDAVYGNDAASLNRIFAESDYVLCAAPLTNETRGMIGKEQFDSAKKGCVFINVGRGPIVDEPEMIRALQDGRLKGAALDVFATEPLPADSPLWELDNVLLSPHNMDQTDTFTHEATEFFVQENLPRFVRGEPLLNKVDQVAGY